MATRKRALASKSLKNKRRSSGRTATRSKTRTKPRTVGRKAGGKRAGTTKKAGAKKTRAKKTGTKPGTVGRKAGGKRAGATKKAGAKKKVNAKKTGTTKKAATRAAAGGASARSVSKRTTSAKQKGKAPASSGRPVAGRAQPSPKRRLSTFTEAVKVYEAAVRLMHVEKFGKARDEFDRLIAAYPNETELLDRANVLIQACDNRLKEARSEPRLRGANDYYEVGVAEMNSGALDDALDHLEHALKLLPKADHVLYALAALAALRGEREKALDYLSRSIERREENRYLAVNDVDFGSLSADPDFIRLVSSNSR